MQRMGFTECTDCTIYNGIATTCMNECCIPLIALEKQIPKKATDKVRHRGSFEIEHCPKCDSDYEVDRRYMIIDQYCPECGKLLDSGFGNYCANCGQKLGD